jgi:hypothetical protein
VRSARAARPRSRAWTAASIPLQCLAGGGAAGSLHAGGSRLLETREASIADIHAALRSGSLTCRALVRMYLDRIEA